MPVPIKNNSKEEETCKSMRNLRASIPYGVYSAKANFIMPFLSLYLLVCCNFA